MASLVCSLEARRSVVTMTVIKLFWRKKQQIIYCCEHQGSLTLNLVVH